MKDRNKIVRIDPTVLDEIAGGVKTLASAVKSTLGPGGRNVLIEKETGGSYVTKDGVTVAKEIRVKDSIANIGMQMIKEAASRTATVAGDGTTTATVLAEAIFVNGLRQLAQGGNGIHLKRGIDIAVKKALQLLEDNSQPIKTADQIRQIATVSANNDVEIGTLISEAMDRVGRDGVVYVEDGKTAENALETVEGMQFKRGYASPYFVTNQNNMTTVLQDDPFILVTDAKLTSHKQFVKIAEQILSTGKPLLIICDDIDGDGLATLVVNKVRGLMKVCVVKAPEFGDNRTSALEDIAILTGATFISEARGRKMGDTVTIADLGRAKTITVTKTDTTIVDGNGDKTALADRIKSLQDQIELAKSPVEIERLKTRLARLVGGVAVITVGANSELELREKKDRIDDALQATRAAIEEGIVPGGGIALYRVGVMLEKDKLIHPNKDIELGYNIVSDALKLPLKTICENAGVDINIKEIMQSPQFETGYDINTEEIINMFEKGIIDPTKVSRSALANAASVAGSMLTAKCVISLDEPEKTEPAMPDYGQY